MSEAEESRDDELAEVILGFHAEWISRKMYFKRMAVLGYQQAEALELAENWDDE